MVVAKALMTDGQLK